MTGRIRNRPDTAWEAQAACAGHDHPEWWHPEDGAPAGLARAARAVCNACPVRQECAEYAIEHEHYGMWGGLSMRQRQRIRSERANGKKPTTTGRPSGGQLKLTEAQYADIVERFPTTRVKDLATEYGVNVTTIYRAVNARLHKATR